MGFVYLEHNRERKHVCWARVRTRWGSYHVPYPPPLMPQYPYPPSSRPPHPDPQTHIQNFNAEGKNRYLSELRHVFLLYILSQYPREHPDGDSKAVLTHAVISKNSKAAHVPAFFLSNAMSLAPKIDEVREVVRRGKFQFISIVEI
jgi:hypothetical protein